MARFQPGATQPSVTSITAHPGFAPLISAWFAAFLGLGVIVLPGVHIARLAMMAELTALGDFARPVLALVMAILGGLVGFGSAKAAQRLFQRTSVTRSAQPAAPPVKPIDPELELGSARFDSPLDDEMIEDWPDAPDAEWEHDWDAPEDKRVLDGTQDDFGSHESSSETSPAPLADSNATPSDDSDTAIDLAWVETDTAADAQPLELDCFEDLPHAPAEADGSDEAGLAKEPSAMTEQGLAPAALSAALKSGSTIEALRQTPKRDLSLIQMVERFAAALHEHQDRTRNSGAAERDAALAEGLRALALLTGEDVQSSEPQAQMATEFSARRAELRHALEKLRRLSDVA